MLNQLTDAGKRSLNTILPMLLCAADTSFFTMQRITLFISMIRFCLTSVVDTFRIESLDFISLANRYSFGKKIPYSNGYLVAVLLTGKGPKKVIKKNKITKIQKLWTGEVIHVKS